MTRISKRVREEAAQICSMLASDDGGIGWLWKNYSREATTLVVDALAAAVQSAPRYRYGRGAYAEAECLLRTGWTP